MKKLIIIKSFNEAQQRKYPYIHHTIKQDRHVYSFVSLLLIQLLKLSVKHAKATFKIMKNSPAKDTS